MDHPDRFENPPIPQAALPDYAQVELNPVVGNYLPYALVGTTLFWLVPIGLSLLGAALPAVRAFGGFAVTTGLCLVLGLSLSMKWLDTRRRGWALRKHDLIYRSGVLWRRTVILPFARIQHVETASGPLERLFGLMRVKCFTAGGTAADLEVLGLDVAQAQRVQGYLLEQIRDDAGGARSLPDDADPA